MDVQKPARGSRARATASRSGTVTPRGWHTARSPRRPIVTFQVDWSVAHGRAWLDVLRVRAKSQERWPVA